MIDVVLDSHAWQDVDAGTEALLDKWLVAAGDRVRAGQPLASIVLVKSTLEVVAPADGRLAEILVPASGTFGAGQPLARLDPAA
jgi:pyruvate/2-oxoglutarate dehydrogenase complex dihydrolipoamide acyltransferase (E2) component